MRTRPLLRKIRHRAIITPVIPLRTMFVLSRFTGHFIIRSKLLSSGNSSWIGIQIQCSICKSVVSKNTQTNMNYI